MKTKGKKAEKKKEFVSTKEVKSPVVAANIAKSVAEPEKTAAIAIASENAPIEVVKEEPALVSAKKERKTISSDERRRLISLAAYYRAQSGGFGKTNPIEDWLLAEREVDAMIASGQSI